MSNIYQTWCDRIDSGIFTKGQCQQWAHAVYALSVDEMPSGATTKLDNAEARQLRTRLRENPVGLTSDHTAQGLDWLRKYASKRLPNLPADVYGERFSRFVFRGEAVDCTAGQGWRTFYSPVWRIITTDGAAWDYYATAWQGGRLGDEAWEVCGPDGAPPAYAFVSS